MKTSTFLFLAAAAAAAWYLLRKKQPRAPSGVPYYAGAPGVPADLMPQNFLPLYPSPAPPPPSDYVSAPSSSDPAFDPLTITQF
jgi:hypothetical protein